VNAFLQTLKNLGPVRLAAMGGVALLMLGFFIYVTSQLSSQDMALLYSDLDLADGAEIAERLDAMEVDYQLAAGGATIRVPADQVDRIRLAMAQEGLPSGGSLGYEVFDEADGFGTSNFIQNINRLRALEGELARTIATIDQVRHARVHLVLPEREIFSRDRQQPSASIFLRLSDGGLSATQVEAVRHLVSSAVPELEPDSISVVDDRGNLLASGPGENAEDLRLENAEQMRRETERRLSREIEQLLARSLGPDRVLARVSVEMNFDEVTINEETYDPNSQVARSTQFVEENQSSTEGDGIDPVTVAENLPEAQDLGAVGGPTMTDESSRIEETTNYEISRRVENRVREGGEIERLSVAVMVDGTYEPGPNGDLQYSPRSDAEMDQIAALVRTAAGFDAQRGDTVEVVNMRFATGDEPSPVRDQTLLLGMTKDDLMQLAQTVILAIVAILVILLVVRPLVNRAMDMGRDQSEPADEFDGLLTDQSGLQKALAGPGMGSAPGAAQAELSDAENTAAELDALIDINQVEGRVRASSIRKVGDIVEKHPEEAVTIIRGWLYQE
jgi:flagellar M-ring protein FliF